MQKHRKLYELFEDELILYLTRTGSHSDLL